MFSILHISDLHRSPDDPITNAELISALIRDQERYSNEEPKITPPQAIIVSGDIVQGVLTNETQPEEKLKAQYRTAIEFLDKIARHFVGGDRSKVVIVPGNHDVDWNTARASMSLVESAEMPTNLQKALFKDDSKYRWDWKQRELYKISDFEIYRRRFAAYRNFIAEFYRDVPGLLRVDANSDVNLFELFGGRITVAAFNSCEDNDCFAFHGAIRKELIAQTDLALAEISPNHELRIAVWHHGIEGPPYSTDYMDVDIVRGMIGRGFRLGLFGHQHKAQSSPYSINLPDEEMMVIVSAGSLCAGREALPTGQKRQYNIIELSDNLSEARIHVREMHEANLFGRALIPSWGGRSYTKLKWKLPSNAAGKPIKANEQRRRVKVIEAEVASKRGDLATALNLLSELQAPEGYERSLLLEIAVNAKAWNVIVQRFSVPESIAELITLVQALIRLGRYDQAQSDLDKYGGQLQLPAPLVAEQRAQIATEKRLRQ